MVPRAAEEESAEPLTRLRSSHAWYYRYKRAVAAIKETLVAHWDLQDEESGDNLIAQVLDAVLTWAMWHDHILSALRRLDVFRAERYVNVARAVSVLDTEAYSASKTAYVNDKLNYFTLFETLFACVCLCVLVLWSACLCVCVCCDHL